MNEKIIKALINIELENDCKILFACESGSRAWGFASNDSDYDIRFIYVNKLSWYLHLDEKSDTINKMLPDALDLSGWDLQKALKLFAKCNLSLNEWLGSPIVYYQDRNIVNLLKPLIPQYFNSKKAVYHYLSTAENLAKKHFQNRLINIKKLFYVIRSILACAWILQKNSMPPTKFSELISGCSLSNQIIEIIKKLLDEKQKTDEQYDLEIPQALLSWIDEQMENFKKVPNNEVASKTIDWEPLNLIMIELTQ